ncbi:MAG: ClC family H(+)/Cl(-) exchange transporter [Actinobacteria bacterium]|nr:ClC family H(+)/Cl(-) exchange transporter [Actinomycetota bacterium]MCG2803664.1 ClC family H(+)/Cl(-) exchange transporter [Cellulomonas sp.]
MPSAVVVGLVIAWAVRRVPAAGGSGIPQVKGVLVDGLVVPTWPVLGVRFLGGGLGALAGLSLGREGPCVQIGASAGQVVASAVRSPAVERDHLVTAGAAAGLSAAFNAPLSGMVFALEELHRSFSPLVLLAAAAGALGADVVSSLVFGLRPVLDFGAVTSLPLGQYPWLLVLGPAAGVVAVSANRVLLGLQSAYGRMPAPLRPVLALLIALPVGLTAPMLLGGGDRLVRIAEQGAVPLVTLMGLLIGKLVFTGTSFGSGAPGGIFMPLLSLGALTGAAVATGARYAGLPASDQPALVLCAMAGVLAASLQAPITAILLVVEMSGRVVHVLPVAACALLALLTADLLRGRPIYDQLLERFLAANPSTVRAGQVVLDLPVERGSRADGIAAGDLALPDGVRVTQVRHGDLRHTPGTDRVLSPGDHVELQVTHPDPARARGATVRAVRRLFRHDLPGDGR